MKDYKILNINGAVLDKYQFERYLEKVASDHVLQNKSDKDTYPVPRLKDNFKFITKTYELLNLHLKKKINIHPAGEWLLDNYYILEESYKTICKDLDLEKYIDFVGVSNGVYKGFARIYVLAAEIIAYTDSKIDAKILKSLLDAYQRKKTLNMDEIWNIGIFLQIAIIEHIREVCEKIYSSQMQKYKVENIIERLVEKKPKGELDFKNDPEYKTKLLGFGEMKYPFIEYLSYRLKSYGRQGSAYLDILEEEVNKIGVTVSDVIKKEHFDIALKKVSIGNSIMAIKEIFRINFLEIFESINGVEEILNKDPAGIYEGMDYKTKKYYRNVVKEISEKTKISELYIAAKALELANEAKNNICDNIKKTHIGYYLISDGIDKLSKKLKVRKPLKVNKKKVLYAYITTIVALSFFISEIVSLYVKNSTNSIILAIVTLVLIYIPVSEFITQILQCFLNRVVKTKLIPKMDFSEGVPEKYSTFVVLPTIISNTEKLKKLIHKLEVYYLSNKSENIYFAVLGDVKASDKEVEKIDSKIAKTGIEIVEELNKKYPSKGMPKFHFLYRNRVWYSGEKTYLGWERKRGLLNQFNEYILGNSKNNFRANTIESWKESLNLNEIPKIKYVITLDSDTELVLGSGLELIGSMAHILNAPQIAKNKNLVIDGYGIMQPRVGIDLESSRKTLFTRIFSGAPGTDSYTNAISDVYQDNFEEGIFTGKGIYDLEVFSKVLREEIPENTVLSHDLLEGNYLRCGLVSDILLLDGYPTRYNSFMQRQTRWIRGDWQIIRWLKKYIKNRNGNIVENPLNKLSKFKILDNLRRSLVDVFILLSIIFLGIINFVANIRVWPIIVLIMLSIFIPVIIDIIQKGERVSKQRSFSPFITGIKASVYKAVLGLAFLPTKAFESVKAIAKTLYRVNVTKQNLLEWTTAEEAEKMAKTDIISYMKFMKFNIILGSILILYSGIYPFGIGKLTIGLLGVLWIVAPSIAWYISLEPKENTEIIEKEELEYVNDIGLRTWRFFKTYINKENNFMLPDNYQEGRINEIVDRTSSTNMGLALLAVVSSYDLGYENIDDTINLLENMINTIDKLQKWNGHLYNWYNTKTLEPLIPRFISTVDSGNLAGYLYTLKQFLENMKKEEKYKEKITNMINIIDKLINQMNFKELYSTENGLFSIGFNVEENKLIDSYYDLLASEARQASLVAIAKEDIPPKHWNNLSRTLTIVNKYKGLISWSGTAFEYLMPNINIEKYRGSLIDESSKFLIMAQKEYAKKLNIPWGISEAAFNLKDLNSNYQYKAFGIPWLGLKRGLADDIVVAPYASIMALPEDKKDVIENMKELEKEGALGKYGFYEAIDYTPSRLQSNQKRAIVKTYMAHHQGLILLSINNFFNDNILQKRFMSNPEIEGINILLQERMPQNVIVTKEKKEKVEKLKYQNYDYYSERVYTKFNNNLNNWNTISNDNYTVCINERGEGFSKYNNILINRYKETNDNEDGIFFYIKNIKNKRIWTSSYMKYLSNPDRYSVHFMPDKDKFKRTDGNIETVMKIVTSPNEPVEIRSLELKNNGNLEEILEVTSYLEPVLSTKEQDYSHMTFNNLFLKCEYLDNIETMIVKRNARGSSREIYLGVNLYSENETIGELEYEIDKEKLLGRGNLNIPKMIEESKPFSKVTGVVVDPIVAFKRTIKIKPGEKVVLNLIMCVSDNKENIEKTIKKYQNSENIKRVFELSKAKAEEEARYLGISVKDNDRYQKMLSYIVSQNRLKKLILKKQPKNNYSQKDLWQYGISGDLPIILLKIKDVNDIDRVKDMLKAYEFFRVKNINVDLVILDEEKSKNERYVREAIETEILNRQLAYLKNIKGGILLIGINEVKDKNLFEFVAKLSLDAHDGDFGETIKYLENEYIKSLKNIETEKIIENSRETEETYSNNLKYEELKYYNEYGGFSEDGLEYKIRIDKNNRLPTVWSHVIANENFGTVLTDSMGGFTWVDNSRLNKLTVWSNNQILDTPSEIIYLKDKKTGKSWSLGCNPMPDNNNYYITYGFGYAKYSHTSDGILQELDVYVPKKDKIKVNILKLKNTMPEKRNLKLVYYINPVLEENELKSNGYIDYNYIESSNLIYSKNLYNSDFKDTIMYVSSSEKISSYTGNKNSFIGNGTISNPEALSKICLDKEKSLGETPCIAIQIDIELEPFQSKELSLLLGAENNLVDVKDVAYKYSNIENCKNELKDTKKYWYNILDGIKVNTPIESMNIMLNGWILYQTIVCRLWARTAFYQCGGALGFRDQLQDTLAIKYILPDMMKNQIIKHSEHQFIEGDVEHWWHEETRRGIRTKFSDDLLWICYLVSEYINFSNDESILDIQTPYIKGDILDDDTDEIYDEHLKTDFTEDIYSHCIKAIDKSLNFGENGLPKIGSGDWNDGLSTVGNKGKGESVWLGFFLYDILNRFIPICDKRKDIERVNRYKEVQEALKKALNTKAWDGRWYKRAFADNGDVLGSIENEECRIDSIAQSWGVISNAAENDKKYISIESLENHLIDRESGIIKLLDSPFDKGKLEPGYIKAYLPGVRENGGQYTHECCAYGQFYKILILLKFVYQNT